MENSFEQKKRKFIEFYSDFLDPEYISYFKYNLDELLAAKKEEGWISVEDNRMPDHNGIVLCYNINEPDSPACIGVQVADGETDFYLFELQEESNRVTHWMELPELPKP